MNDWDDAATLRWICTCLVGRAQKAYSRFPDSTHVSFSKAKDALNNGLSQRLDSICLQVSFKQGGRRNEGWADFGEDLRLLANKAFPDLDDAARERLALTSYLSQLENSQTAVGVKQHRPKTIDEEVRLTLELESYQLPAKNAVVAEVRWLMSKRKGHETS